MELKIFKCDRCGARFESEVDCLAEIPLHVLGGWATESVSIRARVCEDCLASYTALGERHKMECRDWYEEVTASD